MTLRLVAALGLSLPDAPSAESKALKLLEERMTAELAKAERNLVEAQRLVDTIRLDLQRVVEMGRR